MALISLIISAAALAGVLVSLVYQSRQTRISQEGSIRESHRELLMLSLNDPVLRACWGSPSNELPNDQARQVMFANLIVTWWQTQYVLKELGEAELAISLTTFFRGGGRPHLLEQGSPELGSCGRGYAFQAQEALAWR
ncbi:DUF6082 family protein [Streptomyces venezuelae]|uniref:DUF6082 family protein n=1 Tax=Streptomyces venezuelae TaxID=54571 RepID=UPI003654E51F